MYSGLYQSRDEAKAMFGEIRDAWEELRFVTDELVETGGRVVQIGGMQGKGRASGVEISAGEDRSSNSGTGRSRV